MQSLLRNPEQLHRAPLQPKTVDQLLAEVQTPLNAVRRHLIRRYLMRWCQNAVGYRENTKSVKMKHHHQVREAVWHIAQLMAGETAQTDDKGQTGEDGGHLPAPLIPDAELFFFLKTNEALELMRGAERGTAPCLRAPSYLAKAKLRRRLFPQMDALRFDEFIKGFRMAPRVRKVLID